MENSVEEIKKAKEELEYLSSDKEQRELYLRRKMAISDRVSDLENAEKKGGENMQIEIAKKLLEMDINIEQIILATGLSEKRIRELK